MPIKKPKTLFVSDLDGTLLGKQGQLSAYTCSVIHKTLQAGHLFTAASGRSSQAIAPLFRSLDLPLPVIDVNGAYMTRLPSFEHEAIFAHKEEIAYSLLRLGEKSGVSPFLAATEKESGKDVLFYDGNQHPFYIDFVRDLKLFGDPRLMEVNDFHALEKLNTVCLTYVGKKEELLPLLEVFQRKHKNTVHAECFADSYKEEVHWLLALPAGVSKAAALKQMIAKYSLEDYRLCLFGDENNDLSLFEQSFPNASVLRFTPENGIEALKARADAILAPHWEDSVAKKIESLL